MLPYHIRVNRQYQLRKRSFFFPSEGYFPSFFAEGQHNVP